MMDQLLAETLPTLHPDSVRAQQASACLQELMAHYAHEHPPRFWATMVSAPYWREERPAMIRALAVADGSSAAGEREALLLAELHVLAIEAVAAHWEPEQCRIATVRIDGKILVSLVCSMEGGAA